MTPGFPWRREMNMKQACTMMGPIPTIQRIVMIGTIDEVGK